MDFSGSPTTSNAAKVASTASCFPVNHTNINSGSYREYLYSVALILIIFEP